MPIPKHLRHFYRGKAYQDWRNALLERAGGKCEQCRKRNGFQVETCTPLNVAGLRMAWRNDPRNAWRDQHGKRVARVPHVQALRAAVKARRTRIVTVVLTAAHLNHIAGDDRMENGMMLCQWCHLNYDRPVNLAHSRETRRAKKGSTPECTGIRRRRVCAQ
jgi:hypothetical protein